MDDPFLRGAIHWHFSQRLFGPVLSELHINIFGTMFLACDKCHMNIGTTIEKNASYLSYFNAMDYPFLRGAIHWHFAQRICGLVPSELHIIFFGTTFLACGKCKCHMNIGTTIEKMHLSCRTSLPWMTPSWGVPLTGTLHREYLLFQRLVWYLINNSNNT